MSETTVLDRQSQAAPEKLKNEEILRFENEKALKKFATIRGHETDTNLDDENALMVGLSDMQKNHQLLQDLASREIESNPQEPLCTVTIPVALLREDLGQVLQTIDVIKKSHGDPSQPLEIVLWANATYEADNKTEIEAEANVRYGELIRELSQRADDTLYVKSALQLIPKGDFSMSKLRSDYMDAVAIDCYERGFGFTHPIMWLDADTTFVSKGAIGKVADGIKKMRSVFAHANLSFTIDWAGGMALGEMDDATKAVAINEINRRQASSLIPTKPVGYIEESGLVFSTGLYLNAGGVDKSQPINESFALILKASTLKEINSYALRDSGISNNLVPYSVQGCMDDDERFADSYLTSDVYYVRGARIGTSARRHYEVAKMKGASGLFDVDASGYADSDGLYTEMDTVHTHDAHAPISNKDMQDLVDRNVFDWQRAARRDNANLDIADPTDIWERASGLRRPVLERVEKNKRIGHKLVDRYFDKT